MTRQKESKVSHLVRKGVRIACPESVEIGDEVDVDKISGDGVTLHAGIKIFGDRTLILRKARIGLEGPATVKNCQIGPEVELKGGFFEDSVFLAKATAGLGSHVREASIFEEQASIAHTVGTKHTILFPFVTLGSLINFCDCLMAGGDSRRNHSEVGSSYIHFNFTPNQDKATPSLIGDVPQGVMLNQPPIFLGGQGGLVGPCRLAYGTTVAAGTIVRKDELRPGRLLYGGVHKEGNVLYQPGGYRNEKRVVINNIIYVGNLIALAQWYRHVRGLFVSEDFTEPLLNGLKEKLDRAVSERIHRFEALCAKIRKYQETQKRNAPGRTSSAWKRNQELVTRWSQMKESFDQHRNEAGDTGVRDSFLEKVQKGIRENGLNYIAVIQGLTHSDGIVGSQWLQGIVDRVVNKALSVLPSFK
jgi:bifunctional UDP-N-acetylglucosamine pyrophosphorylase / glucosamine-1-phosphate N-acetyltransferase